MAGKELDRLALGIAELGFRLASQQEERSGPGSVGERYGDRRRHGGAVRPQVGRHAGRLRVPDDHAPNGGGVLAVGAGDSLPTGDIGRHDDGEIGLAHPPGQLGDGGKGIAV